MISPDWAFSASRADMMPSSSARLANAIHDLSRLGFLSIKGGHDAVELCAFGFVLHFRGGFAVLLSAKLTLDLVHARGQLLCTLLFFFLLFEFRHLSADEVVQFHPSPLFVAEVHANVVLQFAQVQFLIAFHLVENLDE